MVALAGRGIYGEIKSAHKNDQYQQVGKAGQNRQRSRGGRCGIDTLHANRLNNFCRNAPHLQAHATNQATVATQHGAQLCVVAAGITKL